MHIAITDDRASDLADAKNYIQEHIQERYPEAEEFVQIETFSSAEELLRAFEVGKYDILVLDIYMRDMSGMEAAKIIRKRDAEVSIIFLTSSVEHVLEGYRVFATGYFIKPIMEHAEDFARTMQAAKELKPESLTVHTLAIKRTSRLQIEKWPLPDGREAAEMVEMGRRTAQEMGMKPYYLYRQKYMAGNQENVGYALPGHACQYNVDIMEENTHILAFGAGGISKRVFPEEGHIERQPNVSNIEIYIERHAQMAEKKRALFLGKNAADE